MDDMHEEQHDEAPAWLDWKTVAVLACSIIGVLFWGWYSLFYSVITSSVEDNRAQTVRQWESINRNNELTKENKWRTEQIQQDVAELKGQVREIERELGWRNEEPRKRK